MLDLIRHCLFEPDLENPQGWRESQLPANLLQNCTTLRMKVFSEILQQVQSEVSKWQLVVSAFKKLPGKEYQQM